MRKHHKTVNVDPNDMLAPHATPGLAATHGACNRLQARLKIRNHGGVRQEGRTLQVHRTRIASCDLKSPI